MLSDVFVHFKLWIDERERIVPRRLVPARKRNGKKRKGYRLISGLVVAMAYVKKGTT